LSRNTIWAGGVPGLEGQSFGMVVTFTKPAIAERAMYFGNAFAGGHESAGVNELSTSWFLAEGTTGPFFETFVLLANPNDAPAEVTLLVKTFKVNPASRFNVSVGPGTLVPELTNEEFGAVITSTVSLAVERALYSDANGQVWAAGTNATAARLP
jgi:hypothetical protein